VGLVGGALVMNGPTLVILAAGRARRYGGLKQLAPIGMHGEGVIDLLASDAFAAGFDHVVIVINPDTGPQIIKHVEAYWPKDHRISFAIQENLRGTVDAVLCARPYLNDSMPFGVSNADDLYGRDALVRLGRHLMKSENNCLIGFQLEKALLAGHLQRGQRPPDRDHRTKERADHPRRLRGQRRHGAGDPQPSDHGLAQPLGLPARGVAAHAGRARGP
jgi:hypothetical protein